MPGAFEGGERSQLGSPAASHCSSSSAGGGSRQLICVPDTTDAEAVPDGHQLLQMGSPCSANSPARSAHSVDSDDAAELLLMLGGQAPGGAPALPWHAEGLTADASSSEEEGEIRDAGRRALRLTQSLVRCGS